MNFQITDPNDEHPPPWFSNEEEPEERKSDSPALRSLIAVGVVMVVTVMLLIPVLQAEILQRRRDSLPDAEVERTALLFTSAVLFGRSEGQAMLFTVEDDSARDGVRAVLEVISERPEPTNQARLQVSAIPCGNRDADSCFVGRIVSTSSGLLSGIRFGLDKTGEGSRVVWVELDERIVKLETKIAACDSADPGTMLELCLRTNRLWHSGRFGHAILRAPVALSSPRARS